MSPDFSLLRLPDVARLTGLRRSSIYALVARGQFPRPVKLTRVASAWRSDELAAWIASRPRAGTPAPEAA